MINSLFERVKKSIQFRYNGLVEKILWSNLNLQWQLKSGINIKVATYAEWVIYNDIFVDGEYDLSLQKSLSNLKPYQSFILLDIGANVGYFTLRAADFLVNQNPHADFQVTLVEGSPSVYKTLQYRVANQTVLKDKIMLLHGLVGELQGEAKILESAFHVMNSVTSNINSKGATVPYINLNSVYSKISQIDLLKCDIEGSEQRFIENHQELLQKVKTAVFEFHPNKCDLNKCIFELQKVGLVTYKILRKCPDFEVYLFERQ